MPSLVQIGRYTAWLLRAWAVARSQGHQYIAYVTPRGVGIVHAKFRQDPLLSQIARGKHTYIQESFI